MEMQKIAAKGIDGAVQMAEPPGYDNGEGLPKLRRLAVRTRGGQLVTLELPREDPMTYMNGAHILFRATVGENILHLRQQADGFDCIVHWGDGTRTKVPASGGNMTHSYAAAGDYHIFVTGNAFAGFHVGGRNGREKYIAAYSMGKWKQDTLTTAENMFRDCVNLSELGEGLFRYNAGITNFNECFRNCHGLKEIPADLFRYNTAAVMFQNTFDNCIGLTALPDGLFRYNVEAEDFHGCFLSCYGLTALPPELFLYNLKAYNFANCFRGCNSLTLREDIFGTGNETTRFAQVGYVLFSYFIEREGAGEDQGKAPALWSYTFPEGVGTSWCFGGTGNSIDSLSNYGEIPAAWKEGPTA